MKKKKLKLDQLKVKSFITEDGLNERKTIKGGQLLTFPCTIDLTPYLTEDPYLCTVFACSQASACLPDGCIPSPNPKPIFKP